MNILVTGGTGFIGSALVRYLIRDTLANVVNVDCLTYAANPASLSCVEDSSRYRFVPLNICDVAALMAVVASAQPDIIFHLAAESHVDRSIAGPMAFIESNVMGTCAVLEAARAYWETLPASRRAAFRVLHVSTDEVYGDLGEGTGRFTELSPYAPSSPYSASKAGSDHLVRAWYRTYGLPTLVTHCTNNYGPCQFPEKLIPRMIINAVQGKALPLYGEGTQIRDWLYVDDHVQALYRVATQGQVGETYDMGGGNEIRNIDVVETICALLEELAPSHKPKGVAAYRDLITFIADRPGHDVRYAIDATKVRQAVHWEPQESFSSGMAKTVQWYLTHQGWWQPLMTGELSL